MGKILKNGLVEFMNNFTFATLLKKQGRIQ